MSRLIVVSNRVNPPNPAEGESSTGGLAMALAAALREYSGIWFGWSGEISEEGTFGNLKTGGTKKVALKTLDMTQADHDEFYVGFANKTLWPVLHYRLDLAVFDRRLEEGYRRVNERFASRLRPLIEPDDVIWVHDYHYLSFGAELRAMEVNNPIGFFLHIPFPAPEVLAALPNLDPGTLRVIGNSQNVSAALGTYTTPIEICAAGPPLSCSYVTIQPTLWFLIEVSNAGGFKRWRAEKAREMMVTRALVASVASFQPVARRSLAPTSTVRKNAQRRRKHA